MLTDGFNCTDKTLQNRDIQAAPCQLLFSIPGSKTAFEVAIFRKDVSQETRVDGIGNQNALSHHNLNSHTNTSLFDHACTQQCMELLWKHFSSGESFLQKEYNNNIYYSICIYIYAYVTPVVTG